MTIPGRKAGEEIHLPRDKRNSQLLRFIVVNVYLPSESKMKEINFDRGQNERIDRSEERRVGKEC